MNNISFYITNLGGQLRIAYSAIIYVSQEAIFKYELSDYIFPIILFVISSVVSCILLVRSKKRKMGFSLLFFAMLIGLFMIPSMMAVSVSVYSDRIEQVTGFWGYNKVKGFSFNDIDYVSILTDGDSSEKILWNIKYKKRTNEIIDISDIWERNSAEIISLLKGYGVHFRP